jgi:hypothetical protein
MLRRDLFQGRVISTLAADDGTVCLNDYVASFTPLDNVGAWKPGVDLPLAYIDCCC